jgi:hypothetical protein
MVRSHLGSPTDTKPQATSGSTRSDADGALTLQRTSDLSLLSVRECKDSQRVRWALFAPGRPCSSCTGLNLHLEPSELCDIALVELAPVAKHVDYHRHTRSRRCARMLPDAKDTDTGSVSARNASATKATPLRILIVSEGRSQASIDVEYSS